MTDGIFEFGCKMIDVTNIERPHVEEMLIDKAGHEHPWCVNGNPATEYNPIYFYDIPSLIWIIDGTTYDEDGEEIENGHYECRICGERVIPNYISDCWKRYIAGPKWFKINGENVTQEEFERRAKAR